MANMFNWKLNSSTDYFFFFLTAFLGIVALIIYYRHIKKGRTANGAFDRVSKKLKRHLPKGARLFNNLNLIINNHKIHFDHLIIDQHGMLGIKTFEWGTTVFGEPDSDNWKIKDNFKQELVSNPIIQMQNYEPYILSLLSTNDIYNVPLDKIAIMADTFEKPLIFIGKLPPAIVFNDIKVYLEKRPLMRQKVKDVNKLAEVISSAIEK